jgi:plasmid maintenance system killer protein
MNWNKISKYGAVRTNGFASKLESSVYQHLKILEAAKEIKDIKCQQHIRLTRASITYIADFSAINVIDDSLIFYEAKGAFETDVWRLKLKLYRTYGPGPLHIYSGTHSKIFLKEIVIPK